MFETNPYQMLIDMTCLIWFSGCMNVWKREGICDACNLLRGVSPWLPDVENEEKDVAHLYHSPELPPCLYVQLKVAEREFDTRVGEQKIIKNHSNTWKLALSLLAATLPEKISFDSCDTQVTSHVALCRLSTLSDWCTLFLTWQYSRKYFCSLCSSRSLLWKT